MRPERACRRLGAKGWGCRCAEAAPGCWLPSRLRLLSGGRPLRPLLLRKCGCRCGVACWQDPAHQEAQQRLGAG